MGDSQGNVNKSQTDNLEVRLKYHLQVKQRKMGVRGRETNKWGGKVW
jgi:hypothetical protein